MACLVALPPNAEKDHQPLVALVAARLLLRRQKGGKEPVPTAVIGRFSSHPTGRPCLSEGGASQRLSGETTWDLLTRPRLIPSHAQQTAALPQCLAHGISPGEWGNVCSTGYVEAGHKVLPTSHLPACPSQGPASLGKGWLWIHSAWKERTSGGGGQGKGRKVSGFCILAGKTLSSTAGQAGVPSTKGFCLSLHSIPWLSLPLRPPQAPDRIGWTSFSPRKGTGGQWLSWEEAAQVCQ